MTGKPESWATDEQWKKLLDMRSDVRREGKGGADDGSESTGDKGPSRKRRKRNEPLNPPIIPGPGSGLI